jgi:hypothetical protein
MWDVVSDAEQKEPMATEIKAEMASARQKKAEEDFLWSPAAFRIPADSSVELLGFARDYFPKRERARTASYVIRVLSPESHAEMLRQTLEALMAQIEDVTRLQEKIVADTQEVKEASTNLAGPLQAARLAESREEQLQNAQHLEDLSHQGQDTLREAMKNNLIPETTIRQWGQTLQQWQKLSEEKMQEAARAMNTAAQDAKSRPQSTNSPSKNQASESKPSENAQPQPPQNSQTPPQNSQSPPQNSQSPPSESAQTPPQDAKTQEEDAKRREQELAEAEKRAKEVLEALRKMEQKANENLDQLQALTLAQRLRKVGGNERELGAQLITNLADTIGLPPQELPDKFKKLNTAFVKQQGGAHDESDVLQGEISRFFERTQKPNYGKVSQDMKAAHTSEELDRMGTMIQSNITIQTSLDLTNWSGRFEKWADDLQPKEQGGGQSGSGQGQPPLDLTKQLIALLRLREKESNLRDQTGVLEWSKLLTPDYKEQAGSLAATQGNLGEALELIHQAVSIPQLDPPFDQVARSMKQSQELLAKPQTDAVTDGAEARSIDLISDLVNLINEQAQRGQQQQQQQQDQASGMSAEEMAFLTQVMRSGNQTGPPGAQPPPPGGRGGGNFSGGTTERTGHGASGDVAGRGEAGRIVNKAGSVIQNAPVEFRDALENYFHNVEKPGTPRP